MFEASQRPRWLRVAAYGPTRSGKTHFAATAPRPAFIVPQNENSEVTFSSWLRQDGVPYPVAKVRTRDQMNAELDYLLALSRGGRIHDLCDTIVVEALSHYAECVEMELTNSGQGSMQGQWPALTAHFKHIKDVLWQLDCHVIIVALDYIKSNKNGVIEKAGARLPGQLAENLFSSVDVLAYFEQLQTQHGTAWQAHLCSKPPFAAGSRIPGIQPVVYPNFNWPQHIAPWVQPTAYEQALAAYRAQQMPQAAQ